MEFSIGDLLVLVEIGNRRVQLGGLRIRLLRQLLRLTGLRTRLLGLLIGSIRSALCLVDTCLGPAINILNIVCVLGCELIQLIQPVFHRGDLPVDPLLACQRIHLAPEALV